MGYTTEFMGSFTIEPPLTPAQVAYLNAFSGTRRVTRDAEKTAQRPDALREAVGLPVGPEGAYFVGEGGYAGQGGGPDIIDGNRPPKGQPGLWCQWVPSEDGTELKWDEGEKFYEYEAWLEYIIEHFMTPWGRTLNGDVEWQGEDRDDIGVLVVRDNVVTTRQGYITYE